MSKRKVKRWSGSVTKSLLKTKWPVLLKRAMKVIGTLSPTAAWTWGGGTALAIRLDHRVSYDIDIFLQNPQDLRALHPARNPVVRDLTKQIQYPGHYMKLLFEEGEIDFLAATLITSPGFTEETIKGYHVPLETAEEVLAKKLHFRSSNAPARDLFDIEAARRFAYDAFKKAVVAEPAGARRLADQVRRKEGRYKKELPGAIDPTNNGRGILDMDILELAGELESLAGT